MGVVRIFGLMLVACSGAIALELRAHTGLNPDGEVLTAAKAVEAVEAEASNLMDPLFASAFSMEGPDQAEDDVVPAMTDNSPREEGAESKCDPNQPPDPAAFGGMESIAALDMPDPVCGGLGTCTECLQNRKCGWCAKMKECKMARSESPECANNLNTDVCSPPCPEMWHLSWPDGRMGVIDKFCNAIASDYKKNAVGKGKFAIHFTEDDEPDKDATADTATAVTS